MAETRFTLRRLVVQLPAEQSATMTDLCRTWMEEALIEPFG